MPKNAGKDRSRRAFALAGLLIEIILVAVIAALAIPRFTSRSKRGIEARLRARLRTVRRATKRFEADTGTVPDSS